MTKFYDLFKTTILKYDNLLEAWEGVNEYLANKQTQITEKGGVVYGNEMVSYDNWLYVDTCKLDKMFNFGRVLGYHTKKWSKLVNNYCNLDYLDLIKHEIGYREGKEARNYNYTYHFDNLHGSGKDCLISLTFTRRKGYERPIVIYNTRASEVTKRLIFDFLLIQRMVEYVYGKKQKVSLICQIPFMFINLECFLMYYANKKRDKQKCLRKDGEWNPYQLRILKRYKEFMSMDINTIKYKVHLRAAKQVKSDEEGNPLSKVADLFARDLTLFSHAKIRQGEIDKLNKELEGNTIKNKQ